MKSIHRGFIIIMIALASVACESKKDLSAQNNSKSYFIVGQGGGFAGTYDQYKIQQDGLISKYDFEENKYLEIKRLKASDVDRFFNAIEELKLGNIDMNSPGNMSQYIIVNYFKLKEHKITWEMNSSKVKPKVQGFFDDAFAFCTKLNQ